MRESYQSHAATVVHDVPEVAGAARDAAKSKCFRYGYHADGEWWRLLAAVDGSATKILELARQCNESRLACQKAYSGLGRRRPLLP
jgi:hypothetical protein